MNTLTSPALAPVAQPEKQERTGAQAVVAALQASGVEIVFGYPGGGMTFVIDALVKSGIRNLSGRTELTSAWMSYGYNRMRRRAASACAFHCVGMLHASPVAYGAQVDATPLLLIDVSLDSSLDLREPLQDSSQVYSALKPLVKYIKRLVTAEDLPLAVRQAVLAASTGRPGTSVLDLAFQTLQGKSSCVIEQLQLPAPPAASAAAIDAAMDQIRRAQNPVIIAGAGVHLAGAADELRAFAEKSGIPVVSTSWGGRGLLSDDHPLFAGVIGSFGWESGNTLAQRADLWIAVGTTFSQMSTGAWNLEKPESVVQIDINPEQLGKIFQPTVGIAADAKEVLQQLQDRVQELGYRCPVKPEEAEWQAWKSDWMDYQRSIGAESSQPINQYYLIRKMAELLPDNSIVVGDSGGQAYMLYRAYNYKNHTPMAVGSRYMSMGCSLPIAIGVKLAEPERTVVSYHGDGGFYYDFMELATLSSQGIKVIVILDNNGCLLANRAGMKLMGFDNPWTDLPDTDFVGLAKSLGVEGERVVDPADIDGALQRALAAEGSYLIDVVTDPDTRIKRAIKNVIPIISDRRPEQNAGRHISPPLENSWPN